MAEQKNVPDAPLEYGVAPSADQITIHEPALEFARLDELPAHSAGSDS